MRYLRATLNGNWTFKCLYNHTVTPCYIAGHFLRVSTLPILYSFVFFKLYFPTRTVYCRLMSHKCELGTNKISFHIPKMMLGLLVIFNCPQLWIWVWMLICVLLCALQLTQNQSRVYPVSCLKPAGAKKIRTKKIGKTNISMFCTNVLIYLQSAESQP